MQMITDCLAGNLDLSETQFKTLLSAYHAVESAPREIVNLHPPSKSPIERTLKPSVQVPNLTDKSHRNFILVIEELNIYLHPKDDDHNLKPSEILKN